MPSETAENTPAMRQYHRFKRRHPDCILFFRLGDFYEMFHEDARIGARVLGVTLTQRTEGVPMAGVPFHSAETYLRRLIQAGYRVAVCDQIEDAAQAKGVVEREITRLVTPGTLTDETLLEEGQENPLCAVAVLEKRGEAGLAWTELSTGAFTVARIAVDALADELARIAPRELLYAGEDEDAEPPERIAQAASGLALSATPRPPGDFRAEEASEALKRQFRVASLAGFDLEEDDPAVGPAGAVVRYLLETQRTADGAANERIRHLQPPKRFRRAEHLVVDQTSLTSLEVERTIRSGETAGSLLGALQGCVTAMGKRLLRHWLCYPLRERAAIEKRQDAVAALVADTALEGRLREALDGVQDVERIAARLGVGRATPRDLVALGTSAGRARALADLLAESPALGPFAERLRAGLASLDELAARIGAACVESPPAHMRAGGLIRDGFDESLDEYRSLQRDSDDWLARYQSRLTEETGIPTLKVGYNKVFGYYIEVTAAHRDKAPDAWSRKQTLKNAERYITPELKEYEDKVLSAEQRSLQREQTLFAELCEEAQGHLEALRAFAAVAGELDVLACFARHAVRRGHVRPAIADEPVLEITGGRHPVLEQRLGEGFVPNDASLGTGSSSEASLALITGPNMAGKSTYIRQSALITLLAHTGAFVPAESATVGVTDRIFTRVGASDELHEGQSTFMVEMTETANICHHATARSLVILDEIGRGTSTLDGLALAWAIAEHLAARGCRALFATHYHELTTLAERHATIRNLNVAVREWGEEVVFLHRILPGASNRSYGVHVARIAGLPDPVVSRAGEILDQLEVRSAAGPDPSPAAPESSGQEDGQLSLFTEYVDHPAVDELRQLDLNELTPLAAFDRLRALKARVDGR